MAATQIFPLALWLSGTNQNSIPANDNALRMQALLDEALTIANSAPSTPADNDQHIVGTAWSGLTSDSIVIYKSGTWYEFAPIEGMLKNVAGVMYRYHAAAWAAYTGGADTIKVTIPVACSDETTAITAGAAKITFRMPHAMTLTDVRASLTTAQAAGSIFTVDINEGGTSILSTKLTIDNTEKTSTTAATPPVISDVNLADDAEITIDVDQIGDSSAKGLKVYLIGTRAA